MPHFEGNMDTSIISTKIFKWVCLNLIIYLVLFSNHASPSSNIVKTLPGFPGLLPFNLETGYIGVDEKEDVQFFYYFVESEGNPRDDPLILWFIGGPWCSGLSPFAFEIGPVHFNVIEYNGSLPTLELNPHSWTKVASIIFIDGAAGSGFSYSKSKEGSQTGDLVIAYQRFSFLKKGYLVGNPLTDYAIDRNSEVPFAHRMTLISDELYESVKETCKGQYYGNQKNNTPCANDLNAVSLNTANLNIFQILEPKCQSIFTASGMMDMINRKSLAEMQYWVQGNLYPRCYNLVLIHFWANDKAVQKALHIREGTIKTWIRCPKNLRYRKEVESVVSYHPHLNLQGYRALVYSGDHDMRISYIGTQTWVKSLNLPIVEQWRPWLVDDQIAGYVTEYSNRLAFATVKGGGHTAPEYRPKECFTMFKRWISQEPL